MPWRMDTPTQFFNDCVDLGSASGECDYEGPALYPPVFGDSNSPVSTAAGYICSLAWGQSPSIAEDPNFDDTYLASYIHHTQHPASPPPVEPTPSAVTKSRRAPTKREARKPKGPSTKPPSETNPSKRKLQSVNADESPALEGNKRAKSLEKNRIAASKCRQKKKEWLGGLEQTKSVLENKNLNLRVEYDALVTELRYIKHQIIAHAHCNDPKIVRWIHAEARSFVEKAGSNDKLEDPVLYTPDSGSKNQSGDGSNTLLSPCDSTLSHSASPKTEMGSTVNFNHMPDSLFDPRLKESSSGE